jgi:uncharacterized membrane protein
MMLPNFEQEKRWKNKTTKEKLELIFIVLAIIGGTLGAIVNYRTLTKK